MVTTRYSGMPMVRYNMWDYENVDTFGTVLATLVSRQHDPTGHKHEGIEHTMLLYAGPLVW